MDSEDSGDDDTDLLGSDRISSSSDILKPWRPPVAATFFKVAAAVMAAGLLLECTGWFWITDSRGVC